MKSRRPRRSEQETRELVMQAATEHVSRSGLRATLDLPMEEVIAAADVPRAAAYRLWPTRERFAAAVLDRLAEGQTLPTLGLVEIDAVIRDTADDASAGSDPLDVACALTARLVEREFDFLVVSDAWRAFLAVEAAVASLSDAHQRTQLLQHLADAEDQNASRLAALYRAVGQALGLFACSEQALIDAAHAARTLARGFITAGVRAATPDDRGASRRRLAAATSALIRSVFTQRSDDSLPVDWWQAARGAIHSMADPSTAAGAFVVHEGQRDATVP